MYRQMIPTLLVTLGLASWADAGFAASIQRAARPVIASTTVDADENTMVVSGHHFGEGSAVVALGHRVLKVKSYSDQEVVVELPADSRFRQLPPDGHEQRVFQADIRTVQRCGVRGALDPETIHGINDRPCGRRSATGIIPVGSSAAVAPVSAG